MIPSSDRVDLDLELLRSAPPPPPLSQEVLERIGEAPARVRPIWPTWARVGVSALVGAVLTTVALAWMRTRPEPAWLGGAWVLVALAWVGVTVLLTRMALREADPSAPTRVSARLVAVLVLAVVGFVAFVVADAVLGGGGLDLSPPDPEGAVRCLAFGSVVEVAPVLVLFFFLARGAPFHPIRAGVLGGVAAAGWAVLLLSLHCPDVSLLHAIPFHLGVALVWGLLGAGIGLFLQAREEKRRTRFPEDGRAE